MDKEIIDLLLVDDQRLMRDGLHTLLELKPDLRVAAEAENGQQALETYRQHTPDVVLMDIRMPVMDGAEATRRLSAEGTVKNYVSSILGKIGARDRTQAALRAHELGLL